MNIARLIYHIDKHGSMNDKAFSKKTGIKILRNMRTGAFCRIPNKKKLTKISVIEICLAMQIPFPEYLEEFGKKYYDYMDTKADPPKYLKP